MNRVWNEKNDVEGAEPSRERSLSAPPQPFSCLTSVQLFAQLHYSCIFLQNTSETHTKKTPGGDLPTFCPPCHGPTKTSKVWVQTDIFCCKAEWLDLVIRNTFSSVNALIAISICEAANSFLKLLSLVGDYNSSFCIPEEIQVNQNTNTSPDFVAWNSWKQTSWACYRSCCAKGKKSWRRCLVGKYVRYTKMTPVIYFAPQTLNNKEFYHANLIFQKKRTIIRHSIKGVTCR